MLKNATIAVVCLFACFPARAEHSVFTTAFTNCSEFAGEGNVSLAQAQPLVPPGYTITGAASGTAAIVVRITRCAEVRVDETPALPTTLSQIGINIVPPDGTGTINNYLLLYVSDNPFLVDAFLRAGVPARYDPGITYQYTLNSAGTGGTLYGAVPSAGVPAFFLYGPETEPPPNSAELFIANWWFGPYARVKQMTTLPAISFGTSGVTVFTSNDSELGKLIGGNAYNDFSILALRGEYPGGTMVVTVSGGR